ncbi:OmpA/MotB family protein [Thiomicrorhabdus lithotrophica]|uniref:Flagellar motor protein MotB n=1 Tax=Thiomicrorhabdus lithotrophica TaxID=2949997 RepID=A0ABY8CBG9_9GAMM|nr:flagellar motor protein MotB [Thiomicrorhabdus lithotrophica]WEJ63321.1 flagellar motor protein MotB [Thiomicrorhabdus lithotrophica]
MPKKVKSCPAWLATFADLMSLLMALFVLLYAMSSTDIPKYKAVVESLTEALGNGSELTPEQEQFFQSLQPASESERAQEPTPIVFEQSTIQDLKPLFKDLIKTYSEADKNSEIKIDYDDDKNQIRLIFPEQIAFDPGRADLKPRFVELLQKFFAFKNEKVALQVIGHTDSRPISGGRFKSNWELSSARAASVIEQLVRDETIRAEQAQAIGLADTQPVSKGITPLDYAKNRRVEVLITPEDLRPR